ncbi:MAG: hypothetical protein B9J98_06290 [Candidatus Terraquivivens tikiterensis]|uniref:DUF373 family protein n=1 Tax=Candidatus Terraquivivens tikiterensis TaxID=1980982 RepID=A0A2R7Y1P7_9ARCH|nr:MAG: hypothetical protein B9J98_06290 [Candidatus Terraquivivens tikiterensis]
MAGPEKAQEKLLILVVDRDDDIGKKTGIKTPIVGKENNLEAAKALALADPEESDANAIFGALKLYEELAGKYGKENVEVATIAGSEGSGYWSDEKIRHELDEVLKTFPSSACIFVSDGVTDQLVSPIISSRLPIVSVKRIVVRQSESIEQTWLLIGRYLKMAIFDSRYSRVFLGIPGALLMFIGILYAFGLMNLPILLLILGTLLFIRGFGIDSSITTRARLLSKFISSHPLVQLRIFGIISSLCILLIGIYSGYMGALSSLPKDAQLPSLSENPYYWLGMLPMLIGQFIEGGIDLIFVSLLLVVLTYSVYYVILKNLRFWRTVQATVTLIWLWAVMKRVGMILSNGSLGTTFGSQMMMLLTVGLLGVPVLTITFIVTRYMRRVYASYFKKAGKG